MAKPRLTIQRLMIIVALAAGVLWFGITVGFPILLLSLLGVALGSLGFWFARVFPRSAFVSVTLISALFSLPIAENEVYTLGASWFELSHVFLVLISPLLVGSTLGWTVGKIRQPWTAGSSVGQVLIVVMLILPWSMVWTHWPLYYAFERAASDLNHLARRVEAGEPVQYPVQAGVYWIQEAKKVKVNGVDGLFFMIDHKPYRTGFVRNLSNQAADPNLLGDASGPHSFAGAWRFESDGESN